MMIKIIPLNNSFPVHYKNRRSWWGRLIIFLGLATPSTGCPLCDAGNQNFIIMNSSNGEKCLVKIIKTKGEICQN
jgi:hypothetical protein